MTAIDERVYSNSDVLVSTDWVEEHLNDPSVRLVESNEDQLLFRSGHIPGAVEIDWVDHLNDPLRRDYLSKKPFEDLMSRSGISADTTVVFYGDKSNWWATYAFWIFQLYGHVNAKVMDGERLKWVNEGRTVTKEVVQHEATTYKVPERDDKKLRAFRDQVLLHLESKGRMVDVRSPEEFRGERLHMPDYPNEGALRGGHIPGADNVPWARATNPEDGTFKTAAELKKIYLEEKSLKSDEELIVYCRIGERSSHTWFALQYLLGFSNVKNYDGSWTEWGNLVNVPIEKP